jgi:hypothetical protein
MTQAMHYAPATKTTGALFLKMSGMLAQMWETSLLRFWKDMLVVIVYDCPMLRIGNQQGEQRPTSTTQVFTIDTLLYSV